MNPIDNKSGQVAYPPTSESQLIRSTMFPGAMGPAPGFEGGGGSSTPSLSALLHALRRRWLLALFAAFGVAGLGVMAVLVILPVSYTVTAAVQITSKGDPNPFNPANEDMDFTIFKANMAARIKSPMTIKAALDSPKVQELGIVQNSGNPTKWLEKGIKTDFLIGPEVLRVTLSGDDPQEVAVLLNAVVDAFLNEVKQTDQERLQAKINKLEDNRANMENQLRQKKVLFRKILVENKLPDPKTLELEFQSAQQRLSLFKKDQLQAQIELVQSQDELKSFTAKEKRLPSVTIEDHFFEPEFERLPEDKFFFEKQFKVQEEISNLRRILPPGTIRHPFLQPKLDELESLKAERKKIRERARPDIEQKLRDQALSVIRGEMSKAQEKITAANRKMEFFDAAIKGMEDDVRRLDPAKRQWPPFVEALNEEILGLTLTLNKMREVIELLKANGPNTPRAREWFRAETPTSMDVTRQVKFGGAAALALFCLTLFGVGFLEFRSGRISGTLEVTRGLGMRVLGTLPPVPALARQGVLSAGDESKSESLWQNRLTEAIDSIRTALMHSARTENVHVIMVTSAGVGEGKTSLATQLAASLARAWRNTLLIDGDLRHPATHKLLDLPLEPGFSEVLRGEATPADAVKPTALSRLWLMPAGHWDNHALQALAQDNVKSIFTALKQQYEFIIVDSCPVLPVADALSLGQNVDGIVYAVLRDVSRFPALQAAQQRMSSLNIRTLGAVLIGANHDSGDHGYQYTMSREKK